jgi:hypothetical protein
MTYAMITPVASYAVPTSLNGYPVIGYRSHANGYATVMVSRADMHDRFVVATWYPELEKGWVWGHYWHNRTDADASFAEVDKRNIRR